MMAVCHQPYSELDKIPFTKGLQYMQMTVELIGKLMNQFKGKSDNTNNIPDIMSPEEYFK